MGSYSAPLLELSVDDRFRFILAAVESVRTNLKTGIRITIKLNLMRMLDLVHQRRLQ